MRRLFVLGYALVLCSCQPTQNCQQVAESGGNGSVISGPGKKQDFAYAYYAAALSGEPIVITNPKKQDFASGGSGSTASGGTIHQKKRDFTTPSTFEGPIVKHLNICNHG